MAKRIANPLAVKEKELWALFRKLPEVTIAGVVSASGVGAGQIPPQKHWSLLVELVAWREGAAGELVHSPLHVTARITEAQLKVFRRKICPESLIAFRAKLAMKNPLGAPRAELRELLPRPKDTQLAQCLAQYKTPRVLCDPQFGRLTLNRQVEWYEGKVAWAGEHVRLSVPGENADEAMAGLETARALWRAMDTWREKVEQYAVAGLLKLKNDGWLGDDEEPFTPAQLVQAMKLETIAIRPEGRFEFWYDDGDLFWGHSIVIRGDLKQGLKGAEIAG